MKKKSALKILHSFFKVYNPIYTPRTLVIKLGSPLAGGTINLSFDLPDIVHI